LRRAEFGFLGVCVYTRVQTPRRCGEACKAGTPSCTAGPCAALANQLIKCRQTESSLPKKPAASNFISHEQALSELPARSFATFHGCATAHGSPIVAGFASASFLSQTKNRGRWRAFSRSFAVKANSVSPVSARIALQGGERADTVGDLPCPPARRRATSGACLAGYLHLASTALALLLT